MWNLGKWCRWSHLQNKYRDTDVERKRMDTKQGGGMKRETGIDTYIYTIDTMYKIDS